MKILIVSYCFAPQNAIGAVRATKLAKYWTRMGHQVTVLCSEGLSPVHDPILERDMRELKDVRVVKERSLLHWWKTRGQAAPRSARVASGTSASGGGSAALSRDSHASAASSDRHSWKKRLLNTLYLWLADRSDRAFGRACLRALHKGERFDVVFSTYGPLSVHEVAREVKRRGMAKRWVADFRDEAAVPFAWQKRRLARYIKRVRDNADAITAVSAGYLRVMGLEERGSVIHNGFDGEDLEGIQWGEQRRDKLCFVHCGQMYGTLRDLSPLFRALRELIDEGELDESRLELIYAGKDTSAFVDQATAAGLTGCLKGYGFMPRDESLKLQRSAHVLLLAAWNFKERQGNLPGKLLEYLMLDRPVLCCVAGELPDSEVAALIRQTNIGFCYENAHAADDFIKLKAYVLKLYQAFVRGEPLPFAPDEAELRRFAYRGVAEAVETVLRG